jgi:Fe-S-cluster containining protein
MDDPSFRPRLRPELTLLPATDRPGEGLTRGVFDPLCQREISLGEISSSLIVLIDGERTLGEVLALAAAATSAPPEQVRQSLRALLLLNLIEGSGEEILARLRRVQGGEFSRVPVTLPEARFQCQGSGDCCRSYSYGPLTRADVARLAELGDALPRAFPDLDLQEGGYLEERETDKGHRLSFLRAIEDRCIFLLPDQRCGIHAHFGVERKPGLCRDYPLAYSPTIGGLRVFDRVECSQFATACRSGPPIASDAERIDRMLGPGFNFLSELEHEVILLDDDTACDYGHFLPLQEAMLALVAAGVGSAAQTVAALGRLLRAAARALRECPLRRGEPDRSLGEVLQRAPSSFYEPGPDEADPVQGMAAVAQLSGALIGSIGPRVAVADSVATPLMTAQNIRQLAGVLHLVQVLAAQRGGMTGPVSDYHDSVARVDDTDLEVEALLRLSLRHQLFGAQALIRRRPVAALARIALAHVITRVGARSSALNRNRSGPRIDLDDFNFGHKLALRALRNAELAAVFVLHEAQSWEVIAAAAALFDGDAT